MRLTAMGRFLIMMVVIGLAIGGSRLWQGTQKSAPYPPPIGRDAPPIGRNPAPESGNSGANSNAVETNSANGETEGETIGGVEIPFVITAAKKDWVADQVSRFNAQNVGKYKIVATPVPSREAMHAILEGKQKPVLWSPGSPIWPARLAQAYKEKNGTAILDLGNPNGYRVYLRSPLVFLTTQSKAKFLRPLLSTADCWQNLRKMSLGQIKTPFGPLNFSHADPLTSSSGMLTIGLIMYDYGKRNGQAGNMEALATNAKFLNYLSELERGLIYDTPAEKGTTALTKAFLADTNRYDLITAYESAALAAAAKQPEIAVIYPAPTAVSEHSVSLLGGDWVSPQQRAGAEAFMAFLGSEDAIRAGIKTQFRPLQAGGGLTLADDLSRHAAQGFQQSFEPIELPPYEALNAAAYQWRIKIAKQAG